MYFNNTCFVLKSDGKNKGERLGKYDDNDKASHPIAYLIQLPSAPRSLLGAPHTTVSILA